MKLIYTLSIILLSVSATAQGTWMQKADFGGNARYGAVGFSIGSYGYIGMGYNGTINYNDL